MNEAVAIASKTRKVLYKWIFKEKRRKQLNEIKMNSK
jgi:hypothetical protein